MLSRITPRAIAGTANAVMVAMTAADDPRDAVMTAEAMRPMIAGAIPATDAEMIAATAATAPAEMSDETTATDPAAILAIAIHRAPPAGNLQPPLDFPPDGATSVTGASLRTARSSTTGVRVIQGQCPDHSLGPAMSGPSPPAMAALIPARDASTAPIPAF